MLLIAQHLGALSRRTMTMGSCGGDGGGEAKLDWHYRLIRTFNPKILWLWGAGSERPKLTKCRVKIFSVSSNETVVSESNTELAWMSSKLLSKPKILWVDEQSCSCCSCHWNLIYVPSLLELSPSAGSLLSAASGCLLPRFLLFPLNWSSSQARSTPLRFSESQVASAVPGNTHKCLLGACRIVKWIYAMKCQENH